LLANAQEVKVVPGRKTDQKDSQWIADLHKHGLLRNSFVPPRAIRDLRDLTRGRAILTQEHTSVCNRIQKVLEDANIKLRSVASDVFGASGRAILRALMKEENDPEALANLSKGKLRNKIPQLRRALEGQVTAHHRALITGHWNRMEFLERQIADLETQICRADEANAGRDGADDAECVGGRTSTVVAAGGSFPVVDGNTGLELDVSLQHGRGTGSEYGPIPIRRPCGQLGRIVPR